MNIVHLVTQEKYRVEKNKVENQAGCTSTKLAQPVHTGRAPSAQAACAPRPCRPLPRTRSSARAPAAPCRTPARSLARLQSPATRPRVRPRVRPRAQRPVALPRAQCSAARPRTQRPACACLRAPAPAARPSACRRLPTRPAPCLRAQLPSPCCIVTQAYPGSQYSLYCNTNLLPTKLYCIIVFSQASHLYCNTLSSLTIQF